MKPETKPERRPKKEPEKLKPEKNFSILIVSVLILMVSVIGFAPPVHAAIGKSTVQSAWNRIAAAAEMKAIPITYEKEKAPNAWVNFQSSDRFSVHVTEGLLRVLNSSDEIAGILGHEVGHVKRGHYSQSVRRSVGWSILGSILNRTGNVGKIAGAVGMNLAESGFSREQEVEADDYGMDLAVKAGYSPWGLYNAMKSFKDSGFKTEPGGFNSHPPTDRRLRHLQNRARRIEGTSSRIEETSSRSAAGAKSAK
ncbi:MAG: M48 family metallopeptidase [Synergistaceae bacterium]|nr:M48 family metallopeptidase [Synergistaceae bacterium]